MKKAVRRCYLAGPINGCSDDQAASWRIWAGHHLSLRGWIALDPMRRDHRGHDLAAMNERIVQSDLEDIELADAVIAKPWKPSVGTSMEIAIAHRMGKRVAIVGRREELSPWIIYHSSTIVPSVGEAISWVTGTQAI